MKIQGTDPSTPLQYRSYPSGSEFRRDLQKTLDVIHHEREMGGDRAPDVSAQKLEQAVEQLNKTMMTYNTELRFQLHTESNEMQVSVINSQTEEVIRKIPPDKILNIVAHFKEILGVLVDEII